MKRHTRLKREFIFRSTQGKLGAGGKFIDDGNKYKEKQDADQTSKSVDDEYHQHESTRLLITTSRDPSSRLVQFQKEMSHLLPNAIRMNRGGTVMSDLVDLGNKNGCTDIIVLHETRGLPDAMIVCHLPFGPTAYFSLSNVTLRHEIPDTPPMTQQEPHLIFEKFSTNLGERVKSILQHLFPPLKKQDSTRVITFANDTDFISFRHHVFHKTELGPRFELMCFKIVRGTIADLDPDVEWVFRPYHRTAHKRTFI